MCKIFILYDFSHTYHLPGIDATNVLNKATVDICKFYSSSCYPTCLLTIKKKVTYFTYIIKINLYHTIILNVIKVPNIRNIYNINIYEIPQRKPQN